MKVLCIYSHYQPNKSQQKMAVDFHQVQQPGYCCFADNIIPILKPTLDQTLFSVTWFCLLDTNTVIIYSKMMRF